MTLTAHATIGAAIGIALGNPILGFFLGFISHFIADAIPHGDSQMADHFRKNRKATKKDVAYVVVDAITMVFVVLLIASINVITAWPAFVWGIIGSLLPDLLVGIYEWKRLPLLKGFNTFHFRCHNIITDRWGDISLSWSLAAQVGLVLLLQNHF